MRKVAVIIPAFNEENSIGKVLAEIPKELVEEVIVVDNNSSDETKKKAKEAGATVLEQSKQGYGFACLKGIEYLKDKSDKPDVVVFLDADYSDYPQEMHKVVAPILNEDYDMVIGSRALGKRENGSMTLPQVFGNWLATGLMKLLYGAKFTDLGPFRAIKYSRLIAINMQDQTYGWTVEMQLKAVKNNLKYCEVPVNYKKRVGKSKISGTLKGTVLAGYKIITTIFKYR